MKKPPGSGPRTRHLSVIPGGRPEDSAPLTRAQVASRLGVSVSTVRRFEGERLHPQIGPDDVRLFDPGEVAALAAELADEPRARRLRNAARDPGAKPAPRSEDELAAQVFERLEQRQSLAEIVVGVRVAPERVRELHEQWCRGLIEGQLRFARTPQVPLDRDYARIRPAELAERLATLPQGMTRISVARYRGPFLAPTPEGGDEEFAWVTELGGFHVSGPCDVSEIVRRFGKGDYRISAYGFNPPGLRWEVIVQDIGTAT
jgi:transcriptional regulator with XRE-family HTH domain